MRAFDEQCCACGYDIEMQSFIMQKDEYGDKIYCLDCYNFFLSSKLVMEGWKKED